MIIQMINHTYPYKAGQIITVSEKQGKKMIAGYKADAKRLTKKEADKIIEKQHKEREAAAEAVKPMAVRFIVDSFPYKTGEVVTLDRDTADKLLYDEIIVEHKNESK